jgi:hypothetical protein
MKPTPLALTIALTASLSLSTAFAQQPFTSHNATIHFLGAQSTTLTLQAVDDHYNKSTFYQYDSSLHGSLPFGDSSGNEEAFSGANATTHYVANFEQDDFAAAQPHLNVWAVNFNRGTWDYYQLKTYNHGQPVIIDFPFIPQQYINADDIISTAHGMIRVVMSAVNS